MDEVLFADARVRELSSDHTLPAKFHRLLKRLDLESTVKDRSVAIKMHLGSHLGYTTVHPLFVRILVEECRQAGAGSVAVMDNSVAGATARGYTPEVIGAPVVSCFGWTGHYIRRKKIGFLGVKEALFGGNAWDADVLIDFSHVKGHGQSGFGGAIKNVAMGCVLPETRGQIHRIQGGITWDGELCIHCGKCVEECPNQANRFDDAGVYSVDWHACTFCQHCIMICPEDALTPDADRFEAMQEAMARVAAVFLKHFRPDRRLFINVLRNITVYCDCWGMSTPALVPDIGILAGRNIVAVEKATLDKIKASKLMPEGLPIGRKPTHSKGHLFQRIHGMDPYVQVRKLDELGLGPADYKIVEVR